MKKLLIFLLLLCCSSILMGQNNNKDYDKICYCSGRETPHNIISYDNNFNLLLELRKGLSKEELKSTNISYTDSQLKLLLEFNLIEKKKNKFHTCIPIFDSIQTNLIREQSKKTAKRIFPQIEVDIYNLINNIKNLYKSQNEFAITFSYVLDGLIWNEFEELALITPRNSNDKIPWTGHFWMMANPRANKCGTNTSREGNTTLYITNGVPWRFMKPLYVNHELIKVMMSDIEKRGKLSDTIVQKKFSMYDLFNDQGEILVPIIYENSKNELFKLASKISKNLCDQFLKNISISSLVDQYNFKNREEALIVFYHETMWELLSVIEEKEIIVRPEILSFPDNAEMRDMTDLLFFVVED